MKHIVFILSMTHVLEIEFKSSASIFYYQVINQNRLNEDVRQPLDLSNPVNDVAENSG